jgi:hypothetical protein
MKRFGWHLGLPSSGTTAFAAEPAPSIGHSGRGGDRNAVSKEMGLLQEWPEDGPPLGGKDKGLGGCDSARPPSPAGKSTA